MMSNLEEPTTQEQVGVEEIKSVPAAAADGVAEQAGGVATTIATAGETAVAATATGKEGGVQTLAGDVYQPHETDQTCLEPFDYLTGVPGKDVRGRLVDAFQLWLQIPTDTVPKIKEIISSLHNASLLIDDIEDNSKLRRGVPVAHSIFGVPSTINCANYVYFLALEQCYLLGNTRANHVLVHELLNLHRGQGQDIRWRDNLECPTEEQYEQMVLDKTGGLFRIAVGLMQAFSENDTDYGPLLNQLALFFQIRDDYVNVASAKYHLAKSFCEDLTEGKFSFPIIHCIRAQPNDKRLINILKQHTEDIELKKYAVRWMKQCGSIQYTRERVSQLRDAVLQEIDQLGGHEGLTGLILDLDRQLDGDGEDDGNLSDDDRLKLKMDML